MFKTDFFKKHSFWLTPFFLFLLSFILRTIKSNAFSLWSDGFITSRWTNLAHLIGYHQFDNNAPLPPVLNLLFKEIFEGNFFAQRFPHILTVSLAVLVFYQMLNHFLKDKRWAFIFSLIPATGYMFVYYSHEIRPYSYLLFLTLVSLYYGYRVIVEGERKWWIILALLLSFTALPLTHYVSWFHFLALDTALIIGILLFVATGKLSNLLKLLALNIFIFLAYIPWADSVYQYVSNNLAMRTNPLAEYRFTLRVFWEMVDKFAGGGGFWSSFLFVVFVASGVYLIIRVIKRFFKKEELASFDKFAVLLIPYWFVFFFLLSRARYTEDIFFWRHYMFLVWPFYILIFYGLYHLATKAIPNSILRLFSKIIVIAIIGFFLVSNLANTTAYFLASDRYFNWPEVVSFIEPMLLSGQKQKIYIDNPGDLRSYLETQMASQRADKIWSAVEIIKRNQFQGVADCCGNRSILIRIATTTEPTPRPIKGFSHMKAIGRSPFLDFLMNRGAAPFSGWYELHYVYY